MCASKDVFVSPTKYLPKSVHILLRLLGISNRPSFHQCPTACMFSFENGRDIETVSNACEFLGDNIWNNDCALVYCIWRRMVASWWLHSEVNEFLWVCFKRQIMSYSYILNFLDANLRILTYDLGSTVQYMNDSPCLVMWVVWLCNWDSVCFMCCRNRISKYYLDERCESTNLFANITRIRKNSHARNWPRRSLACYVFKLSLSSIFHTLSLLQRFSLFTYSSTILP
jgi:hypothetical protein